MQAKISTFNKETTRAALADAVMARQGGNEAADRRVKEDAQKYRSIVEQVQARVRAMVFVGVLFLSIPYAQAETITIHNLSGRKAPAAVRNVVGVLKEVRRITGLQSDMGDLSIIIYRTREDAINRWKNTYGYASDEKLVFYDPNRNVIYAYFAVLTPHVLGHELTHALEYAYYGKQAPKESREVLPQYVQDQMRGF